MDVANSVKSLLRPIVRQFRNRASANRLPQAQIDYLLLEVSELRQLTRELLATSPIYQESIRQTGESFDTQWKDLPTGAHLPGDPTFDQQAVDQLCSYAGLPQGWFPGKKVLDAGCGMGRWSRALGLLGARVTAIDISEHGLQSTRQLCGRFDGFESYQHNLLEPLNFGEFDLVWNYGVCHHTGDTRKALGNVVSAVKPAGQLFTMLYGEPRLGNIEDFEEISSYSSLRHTTANMDFGQRIEFLRSRFPEDHVHGWFDAISPRVNDLYRLDEVEGWLRGWGFADIHTSSESRNLHIVATRAG